MLIGRAYAYGLGAAGAAGVAKTVDILQNDVVRTLKLLGCASVAEDRRREFLKVDNRAPKISTLLICGR